MAIELELNTPAADALQHAVQMKLVELEWVTEQEDKALAEYIMLSLASGKSQSEISTELANDFLQLESTDPNVVGFVGWLVQQAQTVTGQSIPQQGSEQQTNADGTQGPVQDADMADEASAIQGDEIPTGPKSMRIGGKTRGNPLLSHANKGMDRKGSDASLHRIRGGAGIGKNGIPRGPTKGPRGGARGMNPQQMQQLGNMAANNPMGNMMNMNGQDIDPAQMMAMMQMFMGQQPQMNGNFGNLSNGGKAKFDRAGGRGNRGRGRGSRAGGFNNRDKTESQPGDVSSDAMDLTSEADGGSEPWNTLCRFNQRCTKPDCNFAHASPAAPPYANLDMGVECSFGIKCKNHKCVGKHPSPASAQKEICRFYPNCTNPVCQYEHPKGAAPCRNGADCKVEGCTFFHNQTPCKFHPCTNPTCPYKHEEGQKVGGSTSKAGNKIWVNPGIEGEGKTHVSERKFTDDDGNAEEELIIPGQASGQQQQQQQQAQATEEMIA